MKKLKKIHQAVTVPSIPPELINNWGHTGFNYVPVSNWTTEVSGSNTVPIVDLDDKRQITVVFAGTSLKLFQVVFQVAV